MDLSTGLSQLLGSIQHKTAVGKLNPFYWAEPKTGNSFTKNYIILQWLTETNWKIQLKLNK